MEKLRDKGVTLTAILIGLVLIAVNNYWVTLIEVRWYGMDGTCLPIFVTPIFILFLLVLSNLAVASVCPRISLRRGELIVIYSMMVMGAAFAGHDLIQNLFGTIGHAHYGANDTNRYQELFFRYLPKAWFVSDPVALNGFLQGQRVSVDLVANAGMDTAACALGRVYDDYCRSHAVHERPDP